MSTKTTFKRVALVAVASLGFGVLTSVAPASATPIAASGLSAGTSTPARVGVVSSTTITIAHTAQTAGTPDTIIASAKITSAPATSKSRTETNTSTLGVSISGASTTGNLTQGVGNAYKTVTQPNTDTAKTSTSFTLNLAADVAGTYTVLVSVGAGNSFTAGDRSIPVTITTVGAPAKIAVSSVGSAVTAGTFGQLFTVALTDANGNDTVLSDDEGIDLSMTDTTLELRNYANNGAEVAFDKSDASFGAYYVYARHKSGETLAAGSATITFSGAGLLPSTLKTNSTISKVVAAVYPGSTTVACTTSTNCVAKTTATATAKDWYVTGATGLTVGALTSATTATNHITTITDLYGDSYNSFITVAATAAAGTAGAATVAVTGPTLASSTFTTSKIVFGTGNTAVTVDFSYQAPAAHTIAVANVTNSVLSALAGTNAFTAKVTDQYANAMANVAVSVRVSGRNTVATRVLGVTDANGLISYSLTDAGTTGTVDTLNFSMSTGTTTSALAYVNYGTVTVDSVTVSGGSKAETIAGSTLTTIKAGDNGPEGSAVAIKAVVKDASGNLLAGVPVTFTVDAGAIVKTAAVDYATVYTGSDGSASTSVFNWISGKQTITATAGGKSSTDYLTWAANDATSARVLTATATGDIVSLKVVDRFGNAVQGVAINLSRTGAGLFGNGASTQDISTDKNGTADVRFIGSGTVVAELAATYAQAYAAAGNITTKAATAAVAGTTKGTGATLTPAGVAKVSIAISEGSDPVAVSSQAAADAAAEATDAANAATDAANAAAEAADAATAAAQDAADAVAALSTQVSEMVNALKKQITALTNLVIKIQKKVRA
jgi:trimeric autotransporter adhesin